ncbi:heavy metal translocating P-type ATPase [Roseospirillum parvum]|uniref:P-type Zn(2+) transporter n=1 Tax=Roseospirillum parvum TaxID=83401 RepID=A0A1G7UQB6_9PROT|nr:heavy metal translocating P-type ATPase [Roseospirillum parvum]SDG49319.1 ATPase, P-type (transporting), HAD superfamily, subfamily IC/heavy metal translocating P-type ATPase [Roseospirillum parvum]
MFEVVHACPGRTRFRVPALADPSLDRRYVVAYLEALPGVSRARVNRHARSLVVEHSGPSQAGPAQDSLSQEDLEDAIRAALSGQVPRRLSDRRDAAPPDPLPLLGGALATVLSLALPRPLAVALTAVHIAPTLAAGVRGAFTRGLSVEVLDATAVGLAAASGSLTTANLTQMLLSLAEYVESSTRRASDDLLRHLMRPDMGEATVESADGRLHTVPVSQLAEGARVVVGPGETVPVDGRAVDGLATVNQATVTGESLPIPREPGDPVLAGSVVVEGRLVVAAEKVGPATTTARIARFLEEAIENDQGRLSKAAQLADKRVTITLVLGLLVYALTRDLKRLESIFLVDFSCATKLGTSVAIKSAMSRAAADGALVKGGLALEALAEADTVVFDKTGTLTHNALEVIEISCLGPYCLDEESLLALVASVAEHSRHPVSKAVVELARKRRLAHLDHEEVAFFVGHGLATTVDGRDIRIGSRHYLEEHEGIDFSASEERLAELSSQGGSLLFIGSGGVPHGVIVLKDRMRAEAPQVIEDLRAAGIEHLVMITGDHGPTAEALGRHLGLDAVHTRVAPEDKARILADLKAEGRRVAFVGDGVNDAPALMEADIGITLPRGADIARATADVVLTADRLDAIPAIRTLAQRTLARIDTNFKLAAGINGLVMLGAALGRLPPAPAALLHNGTTVGVLLSALAIGRRSTDR